MELESFLPECLLPYFTFQCDQLERRTLTLEGVEYEFNTIVSKTILKQGLLIL